MTRTDAGGSREEAMGNIPDHEAVAHTNMCDAHGGDACDCGATEIARLRAELQREREAREKAEKERDRWHRDAVERVAAFSERSAALRRAEAAEQRLREVEGERDEAHVFATEVREALGDDYAGPEAHWRGRSIASIGRIRAERDGYHNGQIQLQESHLALMDANKQRVAERDAALSDRAALLELLRELDPYVSAKYGMPDELVVRLASALAPSGGKS